MKNNLFNSILVVCYAGSDTKLMKNINKASFKRSHIDRLLDKIIIGVRLEYFHFKLIFFQI
jgi:hypothetical protein